MGGDGDWLLPTGTVLMKNFRLQSGQLFETRLLMRHPDGEWAGYTYQWNGAQTEATRVVGGSHSAYRHTESELDLSERSAMHAMSYGARPAALSVWRPRS